MTNKDRSPSLTLTGCGCSPSCLSRKQPIAFLVNVKLYISEKIDLVKALDTGSLSLTSKKSSL